MKADLRWWLDQIRSVGAARTGSEHTHWPNAPAAFIAENEHRTDYWGGSARFGGWDVVVGEGPGSRTRLVGHDLPDHAYDLHRPQELDLC